MEGKIIVISAVNLRKGGTLTILRQCLEFLSSWGSTHGYRVVALVHRRSLADFANIEYIEIPWAIDGWGKRLWCEYVTMHKISKQLGDVELWLSLHDTTPRVKAKRQAVYCQTSFPFLKWRWRDFQFDPKIPLFAMLTRFAYRINIHRNKYLIVQQEWLRAGFSQMFGIGKERFIVAPPPRDLTPPVYSPIQPDGRFTFFFASTADSHKNFETLCQASRLLELELGEDWFRTIITVKGDENKYARYLHEQWGHVQSIEFAGLMDKPTLYAHYALADCFVFPSRIETWGLPITEFINTNRALGIDKPLLLANLPYAHETSRDASLVSFFEAENHAQLVLLMKNIAKNLPPKGIITSYNAQESENKNYQTYAKDWEQLLETLLG
ncbi:MAG: glycosyltransferase family 1 protein [Porphyromonadaceae bacterium]|nr:glycosyltransferase family 1 protein [Porphyromonadaceae bacterium]